MKSILAFDLGGNGMRAMLVSNGVLGRSVEREVRGLLGLKKFVASQVRSRRVDGIIFGTTGVVENRDLIVKGPNTPWLNGVHLGKEISALTRIPTAVLNDMDVASVGMRYLIPSLQSSSFAAITISSGVGQRIVDEKGKIITTGSEAGHIRFDYSSEARICGCGKRGCYETVLGGESIESQVIPSAIVWDRKIPKGMHPCRFLDTEYQNQERWAKRIYDSFARGLGYFLANTILTTGVHTFVFKGTTARCMVPQVRSQVLGIVKSELLNPNIVPTISFSPMVGGEPNADSFMGAAVLAQSVL